MSDLSILCVTRIEPHAEPFLRAMFDLAQQLGAEMVVAVDCEEKDSLHFAFGKAIGVRSKGYIESVLDEAVEACTRDYVLRLDDDERCSRGMIRWLERRSYETANHWKFPRVHLWGDESHALETAHLWPDHQTRLSVKKFAGNRSAIHSGSPYGGGLEAPCAIEHHKFLVKSLEDRREIVARYDSISPGAGSSFRAFSCPEDFYTPEQMAAATCGWNGETLMRRAA